MGRWQRRWGGWSPAGEDPNPAGFSLVSVVSAAMLVWPDFRSVLSRTGLPREAPSFPEGRSLGPSHLLLPAGLRTAAGQRRGPGRRPGAGLAVPRGSPWRLGVGLCTCLSQFWLQATLGHVTWLWSVFLEEGDVGASHYICQKENFPNDDFL